MSLTAFLNATRSDVTLVKWFRDPRGGFCYATGPVIRMPMEKFRREGHSIVSGHLTDYAHRRLAQSEVVKPFAEGEARKVMRNSVAVEISVCPNGDWMLEPKRITKYSLAHLDRMESSHEQVFKGTPSASEFWEVFDEVAAVALEAES